MEKVILGKTKLKVSKTSFGVIPLQRAEKSRAIKILRKAYDGGINFFDTARMYTDSEEKIGAALFDVRENIVIATKTHARDAKTFWAHLDTSLIELKTDYIDIYQFHNPDFCPKPEDESGLYDAMIKAKEQGKIKHIGITNHRRKIALEAIESKLYETIQYPLSYLSDDGDLEVYKNAVGHNMGFIAMKALCGGLLSNAKAVFLFFEKMSDAVPIYGMQRESELEEFLSYAKMSPNMTDDIIKVIEKDKKELTGNFCRGCGYCMPCPVGINIRFAARMKYLLRRNIWQRFVTNEWKAEMNKINDCIECGACKERCPYGIDCPELMRYMLKDYNEFASKPDKDIK